MKDKIEIPYERLALELLKIKDKGYFSGWLLVDDFALCLTAILYQDDIVPIWYDFALNVDFEFNKLREKYKELCQQ